MPSVEAVFVTPEGSEPMERRESIDAVEGGLRGDRYQRGTGYYSPHDVCEVTLIESEAIGEIHEVHGIDLSDGRHRRNVVTSGVDVHDLLGTEFRIGDAVFRGTRPRPPCAHVEEVANEEGVTRSLTDGRGGICADVVTPGTFGVGDDLEVTKDDPETAGEKIADRLRGD